VAAKIGETGKLCPIRQACEFSNIGQSFSMNFTYEISEGQNPDSCCTINEAAMQTMAARPETQAIPRKGKARQAKIAWNQAQCFLIPARFSTTSTRLLAIHSKKPAIGSS